MGETRPERKPLRLPEYDYGQNGAYFVTLCLEGRRPLFGEICRGDPCGRPPIPAHVSHSPLGEIAVKTFSYLQQIYPISVPVYTVMPDHVHAIIVLETRATARVAPTLGQVVGGYKSKVSTQWLDMCRTHHQRMGKLWQRGYYEHVIRNPRDFEETAEYIRINPQRRAGRI